MIYKVTKRQSMLSGTFLYFHSCFEVRKHSAKFMSKFILQNGQKKGIACFKNFYIRQVDF